MKSVFNPKIKIVVAENQRLMRKSLISLIEHNKNYEVIGEADNGLELIECLKVKSPDVVLMDIEMPQMNGFEALPIIKKKHGSVKVIMLSIYNEAAIIVDLMGLGASSYITKSIGEEELYTVISEVHKTGTYFNKIVSDAMLRKINNDKWVNPFTDNASLSTREIAVMREICNGFNNKTISEKLYISVRTVDFHKGNIYRKIKSNKIADVMKYAIKHGIIQVPQHV